MARKYRFTTPIKKSGSFGYQFDVSGERGISTRYYDSRSQARKAKSEQEELYASGFVKSLLGAFKGGKK